MQVNGKLRDRVEAASGAAEEELLDLARSSEKVRAHLDGKEVVKEVVVPGKLVNLVVRETVDPPAARKRHVLVRRLAEAPVEEWHSSAPTSSWTPVSSAPATCR